MVTIDFTYGGSHWHLAANTRPTSGLSALYGTYGYDRKNQLLSAKCQLLLLEGEGYAAADRAGGINEVDRLAVVADDRDVSLGEEVADVDQGLHPAT